ncbi:MAG TPA: DUF2807 domain-containing protein [Candidatus Acidoferrales bacterium]|nr:DUF2807 domain-containing protein [Candidatus Acidoferrales bacterium]
MSYCWKCGTKLEEDMAYCPKCGTATNQPHNPNRAYGNEDKVIRTIGLAVVGVIVAVVIIVVALVAAGVLSGTQSPFGHIGSGQVTTQQYNFTDFTAISASHGFNVQITQGNTYSIKVIIDDNLQQYVNVHKEGSTLMVELKPGGYQTTQLKAEVTMPDLRNLQLSGGSIADAQNFNVSGDLGVDLSGGSRFTMSGQATDLTLTGSGGSNINLEDLQTNDARVDLSGGSQCRINISGRLDATLSGGSQLHYKGNPTLGTVDSSGGSIIAPIP